MAVQVSRAGQRKSQDPRAALDRLSASQRQQVNIQEQFQDPAAAYQFRQAGTNLRIV